MATLVLIWPDPPDAASAAVGIATDEIEFILSPDGVSVAQHGRAAPALLPRANTVVALLPAQSVSWHRVTVPKAPSGRLRDALGGMLEEQLLQDDDQLHLALAPGSRAGEPTWLAAMRKPGLQAQLAALAAAGVQIDRVACALTPGAEPVAHVHTLSAPTESDAGLWLSLADTQGAVCLPLEGGLAKQRLEATPGAEANPPPPVTATPAAAAAAESWLGRPVAVRPEAEQALSAARNGWDLRQFDLAPSLRGTQAISNLFRSLARPEWRWARRGALALVVSQIIGLNLLAWHQQSALAERRSQMVALLQTSYPQVRAVLDAPAQMARETERLRLIAGVPGDADLEPQLAAAAQAWPDGQPPLPALRFEAGRLSLAAPAWPPEQQAQFAQRMGLAGWRVDSADGQMSLQRIATDRIATDGAGSSQK